MSRRVDPRKAGYKKTTDTDESRRRREETANEIRKNKREESLMKRRAVGTGSPAGLERRIDPSVAQKVCALKYNEHLYHSKHSCFIDLLLFCHYKKKVWVLKKVF